MQFSEQVSFCRLMSIAPRRAVFLFLASVLVLCIASEAHAARRKAAPAPAPRKEAPARAAEVPLPEVSTLCIEAQSGLVISEQNADVVRPPASMLKMMIMMLVAEGVHNGSWTMDTEITVTKHAQGMGGTQVYLKEGDKFKLSELMAAVCVASANDAAMAVAEGLFGSEEACKKRMNERAAELGMAHTTYHSVHGLPPSKGEECDMTTARDMARLGQFCVLDPLIMSWVGQKELVFRPGDAPHQSTNKLLVQMPGCDGIKTGFTYGAGFCITATAVRNDIRLIAVVMGADQRKERFDLAKELLEGGFAQVSKKRILAKGDPVGDAFRILNCETDKVRLTAADDLTVVVKNDDVAKIEVKVIDPPPYLEAPIQAGAPLLTASVQLAGKELGKVGVVANTDLPEAGWRWKLVRSIRPRNDADAGAKQ